ncbi:RHTO0S04e00694g1_1 [Rhodotorula toruloides]|uniref:RHTO0S04e00694g1_1 n=1 Tax=Rhodotorula toruloides TaxID=5286 RepID=A0A061ANG9_RHOTO|nr:RHTO0S04e00694g1_1 [Rhodotorula toruloides]
MHPQIAGATSAAASSTTAPPVPTATLPPAQLESGSGLEEAFAVCHDGWGRMNGGLLRKTSTVQVPYVRLRVPPYDKHLVLVRDVYTEIYAWLCKKMEEMRSLERSAAVHLVVSGRAGIGKSSIIPYLQAALLEQSRPVFYHVLGSDKVVLYNGTASAVWTKPAFANLTPYPPVVCLVDAKGTSCASESQDIWENRNVLYVLAASHQQAPHKALEKTHGDTYYWTLPCAGKEEVENILLLRRLLEVSTTKEITVTTEFFRLSDHLYPTAGLSGGAAYDASRTGIRFRDFNNYHQASKLRSSAHAKEYLEELHPQASLEIDIGGDCFYVKPGDYFTPLEIHHLLGPSFRLCLDTQTKKGANPGDELRSFIKLSSFPLRHYIDLFSGAAFDPADEPGGHHLFSYEMPHRSQPSGGHPSSARVMPTRFLWAALRERLTDLTL